VLVDRPGSAHVATALSKILPDKTSESEIVTVVQICVEE
jgi:hypothetical protein